MGSALCHPTGHPESAKGQTLCPLNRVLALSYRVLIDRSLPLRKPLIDNELPKVVYTGQRAEGGSRSTRVLRVSTPGYTPEGTTLAPLPLCNRSNPEVRTE